MRVRRHLARLTCRALQGVLPASLQSWGWAIRYEVDDIADDSEALLFALSGLGGLAWAALCSGLLRLFLGGSIAMGFQDMMHRPRAIGVACAIGSVMLGLGYMAAAGAPITYLAINSASLALGLAVLAVLGRFSLSTNWSGGATLAIGLGMLATAWLGSSVDGAARWVRIGPLPVQPSLILLPIMIVAFARSRDAIATAGIVVTALALAIQPDRAMAGALFAGTMVLTIMRRDRHAIGAFVAASIGFVAAMARPDALPAAPFVDQILYSAFDIHLGAGLAVLVGAALLIVPALVGGLRDRQARHVHAVFGAAWISVIAAAALGNYPTPIVGYGGSAVLGYLLSLSVLPRKVDAPSGVHGFAPGGASDEKAPERHMNSGLVCPA